MIQPPWFRNGIIINKGHDLACGLRDTAIAGCRDIRLVKGNRFYEPGKRQTAYSLKTGLIGDHDNLVSRIGQARYSSQAQRQSSRPLPTDDDDADLGLCHSMPISTIMVSRRATSSGLFNSQN
jgi:hypothetical protein